MLAKVVGQFITLSVRLSRARQRVPRVCLRQLILVHVLSRPCLDGWWEFNGVLNAVSYMVPRVLQVMFYATQHAINVFYASRFNV